MFGRSDETGAVISLHHSSFRFEDYFTLGDKIGSGSFGTVYFAKHIRTKETVAVKTVLKHGSQERNIKREMIISISSSHPNALKCYEFYETERVFYFVMPLMKLGSLQDIIRENIREGAEFSERACTMVIKDILLCIESLHRSGVVHRNIKPGNVLFTGTYRNPIVRLADFGYSKNFIGRGNEESIRMKESIGTAAFAAPEILKHEDYCEKVDIWSVGILAFYMTFGRLPFEDIDLILGSHEIAENWYDEPKWRNLFLGKSPYLVSFLRSLMEVDQRKRFSATECLQHPWITQFNCENDVDQKLPFESSMEIYATDGIMKNLKTKLGKNTKLNKSSNMQHKTTKGDVILSYRDQGPGISFPTFNSDTGPWRKRYRRKELDLDCVPPYWGTSHAHVMDSLQYIRETLD